MLQKSKKSNPKYKTDAHVWKVGFMINFQQNVHGLSN
jgi:hypothetical protein